MAAKNRSAGAMAGMPSRPLPSLTVELGPGDPLPTYGADCTVTIRGKVRLIEEGRHEWESGKPKFRRVSVEYDKRHVRMETAGSVDNLERENPRV